MQLRTSVLVALVSALATAPQSAHAHMKMHEPKPYGDPDTSPLAADGSDFPCKGIPYSADSQADWPSGSSQKLTFFGSAVHGGGSCQISVTTDTNSTKDSKWKVIHSMEGGCPSTANGNLGQQPAQPSEPPQPAPEGPTVDGTVADFNFTIPPELPNGDLVMAWTWFNRIGNREMYMNCAAVKVSGGASDTSGFDQLPDMAVANIGTNDCHTPESMDYAFENPGKYVDRAVSTNTLVPLCGGAPVATGGGGGGAAQPSAANPGVPSPPPAPAITQVSTPPGLVVESTLRTVVTATAPMPPGATPTSKNACSHKSNSTVSGGASKPPAAATPAPALVPAQSNTPVAAKPAPTPTAGTSTGTGSGSGTGSDSGTGSSCSPDGSIVCSSDGTQFALCNWGKVIFQPVAAGTTCSDGKIAKREYTRRQQRTAV